MASLEILADDFETLVARVTALELAVETHHSFARKETGSTRATQSDGSDCSADLAEARWEVLQDMIEQEQEVRNKETRRLEEALSELPKFAAQALNTECPSSAASSATDAPDEEESKSGEAVTEAFKMITDQIRLEVRQQLEACENRIRSWVKESQASSSQQLSVILTEFTTSSIEKQEASKLQAPAKAKTPPGNLLAAQRSHSNHSCSPERSTLNGAWTPSRPPATLGTPGITSWNGVHTPLSSTREIKPPSADGRMAAGISPVFMRPRVSPWAGCNSACDLASPRRIRASFDGTPRMQLRACGQFASSKSQVSLGVSVQSQRPTTRMTSPIMVHRA